MRFITITLIVHAPDPVTADANKLVINVYVLLKPPGTPPG